ncbi:hypothetical protein L8W59_01725 [Campylobacter lari]|nr:hypothetical protein [Campylobacter lari]
MCVDNFIESLFDIQNGFAEVKWGDIDITDDITKLYFMQKDKDYFAMINFWRQKIKNETFELTHPVYKNIQTRAICNVCNERATNYIFMVDKDNKYPWLFTQSSHLIDYIVIPNYILKIGSFWSLGLPSEVVEKFKNSKLMYRDIRFGFTFCMSQPQHFFAYPFNGFFHLSKEGLVDNIPIDYNRCFFMFKKNLINIKNTDDVVYLYPNIFPFSSRDEMFHSILDDSVLKPTELCKNKKLVIWVGICIFEYRKWIDQEESILNILFNLSMYFKDITIYFNGMTSYDSLVGDSAEQNIWKKNQSFELLRNKISNSSIANNVKLILLDNVDYRTKIQYCYQSDVCLSEGNTTGLIPFEICKKPGVNFIPPQISWARKCGTVVKDKYIMRAYDSIKNDGLGGYHVSWQHIYNLLADILEKLSLENIINYPNLKMHRLDTIPINIIAKQYEIRQKNEISLSLENVFLLDFIENKFRDLVDEKMKSKESIGNMENKREHLCNQIVNIDNKSIEQNIMLNTAKSRIQNQLSYKLGQAMMVNSKSFLGYIRMPFVLSYIKDKHKQEQKIYQEKIKKDPSLKLPPLESYPDYQEALKEKECLTYKLGQALIKANKTWYKSGYIKLLFEIKRLKKEFNKK